MAVSKGQSWLKVTVKVPNEMEDAVSAVLSNVVPSRMWQNQRKESGLCLLKAAVVMNARVDRIISKIEEALRRVEARHLLSEPLAVDLRVVEADEPSGALHEQLRPVNVSPRLAVAHPCQPVHGGQCRKVLLIDPQEAFGDGNHPSTHLALRLLDELLSGQYGPPPVVEGWVLDAGCGSGVLALAAATLGGFKVLAVDVDPRAIDATRGNLRHNRGPGSKVFLALGELSCAQGPFCLVLANLVPTLHVRACKTLWRAVAPGGWLILSGFCQTQKDSILLPYVQNRAIEMACSVDQAWAGTLLHKPDSSVPE
jgi:ribosomal protein L11 methyltransferase